MIAGQKSDMSDGKKRSSTKTSMRIKKLFHPNCYVRITPEIVKQTILLIKMMTRGISFPSI